MYFILFYDLVSDYLERRTPFREEHLKLACDAVARGELFAGGALADPADTDVIIFKGDDPSVAERFAKADPYVHNGIVKKWTVRKWNVVVGTAV
jgi:uncharacterized protein YciI